MHSVKRKGASILGILARNLQLKGNPSIRFWWNWYVRYISKCKRSMAWLYTVLNPTKAAGGVWWIWYSSKCKASMAWLHTVLNPTKAAGGVWWSLMDLVHMATCSIRWAILWSTESAKIKQNQVVDFEGTVRSLRRHTKECLSYFLCNCL